jgi:hypothetical protein
VDHPKDGRDVFNGGGADYTHAFELTRGPRASYRQASVDVP